MTHCAGSVYVGTMENDSLCRVCLWEPWRMTHCAGSVYVGTMENDSLCRVCVCGNHGE